jgi:hypothetical protein
MVGHGWSHDAGFEDHDYEDYDYEGSGYEGSGYEGNGYRDEGNDYDNTPVLVAQRVGGYGPPPQQFVPQQQLPQFAMHPPSFMPMPFPMQPMMPNPGSMPMPMYHMGMPMMPFGAVGPHHQQQLAPPQQLPLAPAPTHAPAQPHPNPGGPGKDPPIERI